MSFDGLPLCLGEHSLQRPLQTEAPNRTHAACFKFADAGLKASCKPYTCEHTHNPTSCRGCKAQPHTVTPARLLLTARAVSDACIVRSNSRAGALHTHPLLLLLPLWILLLCPEEQQHCGRPHQNTPLTNVICPAANQLPNTSAQHLSAVLCCGTLPSEPLLSDCTAPQLLSHATAPHCPLRVQGQRPPKPWCPNRFGASEPSIPLLPSEAS